jgi:hypothetical protein
LNDAMTASARTSITIAAAVALAAAGPAFAAKKVYSYDSASPLTQKMTENGLTFVFDKGLMSQKVLKLIETHDVGQADLRPASEHDLGPGGLTALIGREAHERDLYEITPKGDGIALRRALCRGSDRAWLAFGKLKVGEDLRVQALGHDPATGATRLCMTLDYSFHGEWTLPPIDLPQPDRTDRFNDAPANTKY